MAIKRKKNHYDASLPLNLRIKFPQFKYPFSGNVIFMIQYLKVLKTTNFIFLNNYHNITYLSFSLLNNRKLIPIKQSKL